MGELHVTLDTQNAKAELSSGTICKSFQAIYLQPLKFRLRAIANFEYEEHLGWWQSQNYEKWLRLRSQF
ncbi:hypothetical protein [Chroococcidiopsis sp. SAG 2025]|uniref:hypothetical protein n=1 Tax=Chroococcidiopsis sp. SAG 2025 TaxID=171389 RepID=UPI002936E349|nr:hypothetical protein [Chroococcidiopsis sp. SAG 2025]